VRVRILALAVFAGAAAIEVLGVWLDSPPVYLRADVVALIALTGCVAIAEVEHPPRIRLPALAIAGIPAVSAVLDLIRYTPPPPVSALTLRSTLTVPSNPPDPYADVLHTAATNLSRASPMLAILVATLVSVLGLPNRYRRRVAAAAGMLALACTVPSIGPLYDQGRWGYYGWDEQPGVPILAGVLFAAIPLGILALAGLTATIAVRRAPLAALGLAVLVIPALLTVGAAQLVGIEPTAARRYVPPNVDVIYAIAVEHTPANTLHPEAAILHACYLTALVLLAFGALAAQPARRG
jgi:hypothetical protein